MLPDKQQSRPGRWKSQHWLYPPTGWKDVERESRKPGANASFSQWLPLILVSPEDDPRLMGVLVGLTPQQFLLEKKIHKKEAEYHNPLLKGDCSLLLFLIPAFRIMNGEQVFEAWVLVASLGSFGGLGYSLPSGGPVLPLSPWWTLLEHHCP